MTVSLRHLKPGNLFFGVTDFGGRAICLVVNVGDGVVAARQIAMQLALRFDMYTGSGNTPDGDYPCRVTSVEQPPDDISATLQALDRRYGEGGAPSLTEAERRAILWFDGLSTSGH
jgi:hypothetical protein